jgi:hypothetical protein
VTPLKETQLLALLIWQSFFKVTSVRQDVGYSEEILFYVCSVSGLVQGCSGMKKRQNDYIPYLLGSAVDPGDSDLWEELGHGMSSQCDNQLWLDQLNLSVKVWTACFNLAGQWVTVLRWTALDYVAYVDVIALHVDGG